MLFSAKYDGDITFAFDNIEDYDLIENKLKMIRIHTHKQCLFYVLCGFDRNDQYDENFWRQDIEDTFKRIELLMKYKCVPYIMRFEKYQESPYKGMYITIARWCNQPSFLKKKSLREYAEFQGKNYSPYRYITEFENVYHDIANKYYDMKWS